MRRLSQNGDSGKTRVGGQVVGGRVWIALVLLEYPVSFMGRQALFGGYELVHEMYGTHLGKAPVIPG